MKKYFFSPLLAVLGLFASALNAQTPPNVGNLAEQNAEQQIYLKAKVKTINEYLVNEESDAPKTGQWTGSKSYDKKGRLVVWTFLDEKTDENNNPYADTVRVEYVYLENGLLERQTWFDKDIIFPAVTNFQYDNTFRPVKQFVASTEPREYDFVYNDEGVLTEKIGLTAFPLLDENGNSLDTTVWAPIDRYAFVFNPQGKVIKYDFFYAGELLNYFIYDHSPDGRMLTTQLYFPALQVPMLVETRFFDANGLPEKKIVVDLQVGEDAREVYKYDIIKY